MQVPRTLHVAVRTDGEAQAPMLGPNPPLIAVILRPAVLGATPNLPSKGFTAAIVPLPFIVLLMPPKT